MWRMKFQPSIKKNLQINKTKLYKVRDPPEILLPIIVYNRIYQFFRTKTYSLKIKEFKATLRKKKSLIIRTSFQYKMAECQN